MLARIEGESLEWDIHPTDEISEYWDDVMYDITQRQQYKLCKQCGKPFRYSSHRATYCGTACRTQASREKDATKKAE